MGAPPPPKKPDPTLRREVRVKDWFAKELNILNGQPLYGWLKGETEKAVLLDCWEPDFGKPIWIPKSAIYKNEVYRP